MLKSTALVKISIFSLNKSSPSWEQTDCGGKWSYQPLLLGPGCAFGFMMIGKRVVWAVCEGTCQEAMANTPLDGSTWYFRGS